jgi:hypothetical protein
MNLDKTLIILFMFGLVTLPVAILEIWLSWRILGRLGLNRWFSLFALLSWVGTIIVLAIMAFVQSPGTEGSVGLTSAST